MESVKSICCCCPWIVSTSFGTPWTAARPASLSLTISRSLPKFMSIELVMPSNHLTLCPHIHVSLLAYPDCSGRSYQTYKPHAISWEWKASLMESHKLKCWFFFFPQSPLTLTTLDLVAYDDLLIATRVISLTVKLAAGKRKEMLQFYLHFY